MKKVAVKGHARKGKPVKSHTRNILKFSEGKTFSTAQREKYADKGFAMPDGSFPIKSKRDLSNAARSVYRSKNVEGAKKHIKARAKAMGLEKTLPEGF